jgi:hypothetical protein
MRTRRSYGSVRLAVELCARLIRVCRIGSRHNHDLPVIAKLFGDHLRVPVKPAQASTVGSGDDEIERNPSLRQAGLDLRR